MNDELFLAIQKAALDAGKSRQEAYLIATAAIEGPATKDKLRSRIESSLSWRDEQVVECMQVRLKGPVGAAEIAEACKLQRPNAYAILKRLVFKGAATNTNGWFELVNELR